MKTTKLLILLSFILLSFTLEYGKSEYIIPYRAYSITSSDLYLNGNNDIIIGNFTSWQQFNPTISILSNDGYGYFNLSDTSLSFCGYQENIILTKVNSDEYPDIISFYSDFSSGEPERFIRILFNNNGNFIDYSDFSLNSSSTFTNINYGDVNGDSYDDIVVIINNDFLWGIIYNDGTGNFSTPEYFDLTFPPIDIACTDLNDDGRADVVISGSDTEIYFSTETGFQQLVLSTTLSHDVLISDFDNDGDNDVITHTTFVYPNHRVYFFENIGNNQFYEHDYFQFSPFCSYAQIADLNNDSLPDMVFTAYDYTGLYLYHNKGDFQLEYDQHIPINNCSSKGLNCNDFDNNGFNDIAIIKEGIPQSILQLLFNDGQGNFIDDPITEIQNSKFQIPNFKVYPNPFRHTVSFKIETNVKLNIILSIYDLQGNIVYESAEKYENGGLQTITWDGKNMFNARVDKGTYIAVVLKDGTIYKSIKLIKY